MKKPFYWPSVKALVDKAQIYKKSRLFKFCNVPDTSGASSKGIFAVATNSTNQTNKALITLFLI